MHCGTIQYHKDAARPANLSSVVVSGTSIRDIQTLPGLRGGAPVLARTDDTPHRPTCFFGFTGNGKGIQDLDFVPTEQVNSTVAPSLPSFVRHQRNPELQLQLQIRTELAFCSDSSLLIWLLPHMDSGPSILPHDRPCWPSDPCHADNTRWSPARTLIHMDLAKSGTQPTSTSIR